MYLIKYGFYRKGFEYDIRTYYNKNNNLLLIL